MKTYLVTGVSRGLGKAIAEQLLSQGDKVIGTYNSSKPSEVTNENFILHKVDLASDADINNLISYLNDTKLDGIVNSAGVFLDIDFKTIEHDQFEKTFRVNTFAPLYLVNSLRDNLVDGSSIVNIASNDAYVGSIAGIAYSASKSAIISITKSLANILAPRKIRVNAVAPGWMGDGMQAPEELLKLAKSLNPLKKIGSYEEIANVVLFLLSDKATYVNGETITADGGDMATSYILQKEAELL